MYPREAVEIKHTAARDIDAGAHRIVGGFGVRDNDVQSVGRAALKDDDRALCIRGLACTGSCAREKRRHSRRSNHSQCSVTEEYATSNGHEFLFRKPAPAGCDMAGARQFTASGTLAIPRSSQKSLQIVFGPEPHPAAT